MISSDFSDISSISNNNKLKRSPDLDVLFEPSFSNSKMNTPSPLKSQVQRNMKSSFQNIFKKSSTLISRTRRSSIQKREGKIQVQNSSSKKALNSGIRKLISQTLLDRSQGKKRERNQPNLSKNRSSRNSSSSSDSDSSSSTSSSIIFSQHSASHSNSDGWDKMQADCAKFRRAIKQPSKLNLVQKSQLQRSQSSIIEHFHGKLEVSIMETCQIDQAVKFPISIEINYEELQLDSTNFSYESQAIKAIDQLKSYSVKSVVKLNQLIKGLQKFYDNYLNNIKIGLLRSGKMVRFFEVTVISEENLLEEMWLEQWQPLSDRTMIREYLSEKVHNVDKKISSMCSQRNDEIKIRRGMLAKLRENIKTQLVDQNSLSSKAEEKKFKNQFADLEEKQSTFIKKLAELEKENKKLEKSLKNNIKIERHKNNTEKLKRNNQKNDCLIHFISIWNKIKILQDFLILIFEQYSEYWKNFKENEKLRLDSVVYLLQSFLQYQKETYSKSENIKQAEAVLKKLKPSQFAEQTYPDSLLLESPILQKMGIPLNSVKVVKDKIIKQFLPSISIIEFCIWDHFNPNISYNRKLINVRFLFSNEQCLYIFEVPSRDSIPIKKKLLFSAKAGRFLYTFHEQEDLLVITKKDERRNKNNHHQASSQNQEIHLYFSHFLQNSDNDKFDGRFEVIKFMKENAGYDHDS